MSCASDTRESTTVTHKCPTGHIATRWQYSLIPLPHSPLSHTSHPPAMSHGARAHDTAAAAAPAAAAPETAAALNSDDEEGGGNKRRRDAQAGRRRARLRSALRNSTLGPAGSDAEEDDDGRDGGERRTFIDEEAEEEGGGGTSSSSDDGDARADEGFVVDDFDEIPAGSGARTARGALRRAAPRRLCLARPAVALPCAAPRHLCLARRALAPPCPATRRAELPVSRARGAAYSCHRGCCCGDRCGDRCSRRRQLCAPPSAPRHPPARARARTHTHQQQQQQRQCATTSKRDRQCDRQTTATLVPPAPPLREPRRAAHRR